MGNVYIEFLKNRGLYDSLEINEENIDDLISLVAGNEKLDIYCKECGENRVFSIEPINYFYYDKHNKSFVPRKMCDELKSIQNLLKYDAIPEPGVIHEPEEWGWSNWMIEKETRVIHFSFSCAMDNIHKIDFIVRTEGNKMIKIGQYPSVADLSFPELKEYKKVLSKTDMSEMRRAIGLHAQGIGVGSYVYLRRIIERLIDKVKDNAVSDGKITEEEYSQNKVAERIKLLKDYLPTMLSSNPTIYGIVSKGIHELSEEDCVDYFPVLQECIYMILEKWEQQRRQEETEKKLSSSISKIASTIK